MDPPTALIKYIGLNKNTPPKQFNDFVSYKDNKPALSTISLDDYDNILDNDRAFNLK